MSYDLQVLADNRDALLLAEVAAWLHNLGKLEPRFLVDAIDGETPENLSPLLRIPPSNSGLSQYSIRRFTRPSILQSDFPFADFAGVLYFPDESIRQKVTELDQKLERIHSELQRSDLSNEHRRDLGKKLNEIKQSKNKTVNELTQTEESSWLQREQEIDQAIIPSLHWSLGALLTMFWESEWFEKPFLENYQPGSEDDPDYQRTPKSTIRLKPGSSMDLPALLLLAHGEISGQEKKGVDQNGQYTTVESYGETNPSLKKLRLATAFGFEREIHWKKWQNNRKEIVEWMLDHWNSPLQLRKEVNSKLRGLADALGDTQRPINEISLWDYSASTAALFKTAVAQSFLTNRMPTPATMRWRLASIRLDAFDFLFQANQIADIIARKRLLTEAYQLIAQQLEIELPVASQVYSDEHGLVMAVPELPEWDEKQLEDALCTHILETLENPTHLTTLSSPPILYGTTDVRPAVIVVPPQRGKKLDLQTALPTPLVKSTPSAEQIARWWSNGSSDRCSVCGLRPVGYMEPDLPAFVTQEKAKERQICGICLARRGRRAEGWAKSWQHKHEQGYVGETIWIDEVADINGRFALIVGQFDLDDWLNGALVRSLAIGTDEKGNWLSKPPTFARVFRVWRTTKQFWEDVQQMALTGLQDDRRRLMLHIDGRPDLGQYHAYDLHLGPTSISVIWIPPQGNQSGYLVSVDNLQYIARQLGSDETISRDSALSAIFVEDFIRKEWIESEREPRLFNPEGAMAGRRSNFLRGCRLASSDHQKNAYAPVIPILAEPRTFMALTPANKAMDVVKAIKAKYEREMGKVRNRLPLHLGVVYAGRRTPLASVLDAGRRMLRYPGRTVQAKVDSVSPVIPWPAEVSLTLTVDGRQIDVTVPTVMGDGNTPDLWYPYWQVTGKPTDRNRWFVGPDGEHWVHVCDLRRDDVVAFTPSTFDFEYLDASARRFEVAYGKDDGRRLGKDKKQRPYLLEQVEALESTWETINQDLSTSQIKALNSLIEGKRQAWEEPSGTSELSETEPQDKSKVSKTFATFVKDSLSNSKASADLKDAVLTGMLADALEIHMTIHKDKPQKDLSNQEAS